MYSKGNLVKAVGLAAAVGVLSSLSTGCEKKEAYVGVEENISRLVEVEEGEVSNLKNVLLEFVDNEDPSFVQYIPVTYFSINYKRKEHKLIFFRQHSSQGVLKNGDTVNLDYYLLDEEEIYKNIWRMFCPERDCKDFKLTSKKLEADGLVSGWEEIRR